jgi:hypothetical protein
VPCDQKAQEKSAISTAEASKPQPSEQNSKSKRIFMSETELNKHCKDNFWIRYNSAGKRAYYRCKDIDPETGQGGCKMKFKAKEGSDGQWFVEDMPTCHSCCASVKGLTSLLTLKDHLSEELIKEIEHLGISRAFRSKQIQAHLLQTQTKLVDTKLIHNLVYRVRQKFFGHEADMVYLLEQQKVA